MILHVFSGNVVRLDARQYVAELVMAFGAQQKTRGLGQKIQDERQHQQRDDRNEKYRRPAMVRNQPDAHAGREHAADRIAAEHDRHQQAAHFLWRVFGHQGHHIGHDAADAQPGDEAADAELGGIGGKAIDEREQTEQRDTDRDDFLAPDLVRQRAEKHRAKHHAEQGIAAQRACLQRRQSPFGHQLGQYDAINDEVIAIENDDQRAPEQQNPMKALEFCLIDQFVNVNLLHDAVSPMVNLFLVNLFLWVTSSRQSRPCSMFQKIEQRLREGRPGFDIG